MKYLSAATEVLAGIPSPVEVDVYASRLANELGVDKLAIESQVKYKREGLRKRRMAQREQDQKRLLDKRTEHKEPGALPASARRKGGGDADSLAHAEPGFL